jgi:UDP-GlcNAc:undecaprenyl-phosphate GlcNAc-1-phosphate transferase
LVYESITFMMLSIILAFSVAFVVVALLVFTPLSKIALDQPNHRSLHTKITPRTGGLAIIAGVAASWVWLESLDIFLIPTILLLAICLADDIKGLAVRWRLSAQLVIATGFLWSVFSMPWWQYAAAILALVWMINLYNFMDGADGLAGGMTLFGFGAYGVAAYYQGDMQMALLGWVVSSSSLAFLIFNFNPARIFMGDSGSVPLGFLAGSIGLYGWQQELWGWWFPILVFSPFILDASVTMLRRLLNGEKVWQAHRSHYYQKLIQAGFGHKKTALLEYGLMIICATSAVLLLNQPMIIVYPVLAGFSILYIWIASMVQRRWNAFTATH